MKNFYAICLVALAFLLGLFPMLDPDTWWHLRTAQLIVDSGSLPKVDTLTYTNAGRPWIDVYWLFQLALSALYKLGGASALVLMKATCGAKALPWPPSWPSAIASAVRAARSSGSGRPPA